MNQYRSFFKGESNVAQALSGQENIRSFFYVKNETTDELGFLFFPNDGGMFFVSAADICYTWGINAVIFSALLSDMAWYSARDCEIICEAEGFNSIRFGFHGENIDRVVKFTKIEITTKEY